MCILRRLRSDRFHPSRFSSSVHIHLRCSGLIRLTSPSPRNPLKLYTDSAAVWFIFWSFPAYLFYVFATVDSAGRLLSIVTTDCPEAPDSVGDYIRIVQMFDSFGLAPTEPFYLFATVDFDGRLLSMVWTGWWATPLRASYEWIGPEHNHRDVRTLKYP